MSHSLDVEIGAALAAAAELGPLPVTERDDPHALREVTNGTLALLAAGEPPTPDVTTSDYTAVADDGTEILLRWYTKGQHRPGSAVVYAHGGGMICGSVELYDTAVAAYVQHSGVPFLSVDYRLSPEFPGETPVRDTFAALTWLAEHAAELGVDPARIAVMGDSGGGGVAAGTALLAREAGLPLAKQILVYPMLDDRNLEPDEEIVPFLTWTYDNNYTGWHALLGDALATNSVSEITAPARATDHAGLTPAYLEVGTLDLFRDETIEYARKLNDAGVTAELHVHPGAPHAFERMAPESDVARRSHADRVRAIKSV